MYKKWNKGEKKKRRRERKSFAITFLDVFILKVKSNALARYEFVFEIDVFAIQKDALLKSYILSKLFIRQRNSKYGINEREIRGIRVFELKTRSRYRKNDVQVLKS